MPRGRGHRFDKCLREIFALLSIYYWVLGFFLRKRNAVESTQLVFGVQFGDVIRSAKASNAEPFFTLGVPLDCRMLHAFFRIFPPLPITSSARLTQRAISSTLPSSFLIGNGMVSGHVSEPDASWQSGLRCFLGLGIYSILGTGSASLPLRCYTSYTRVLLGSIQYTPELPPLLLLKPPPEPRVGIGCRER
jgi:hypothetical protein